jgi:hypothetical protein
MRRLAGVVVASALVLAAGPRIQALPQQDKPAAPVPAQQSDRVDIVGGLDSWYKVMQRELHVGFTHERLHRAPPGSAWRYEYSVNSEVELFIKDPAAEHKQIPYTESLSITAQLDDTFSPSGMERMDFRNNVELKSKVVSEEAGRKIEVVLGTDHRNFPIGADEEIHFSRFLMFIRLRQDGNLSKPGTRKAQLFSPREDDKLPVAEIQIEIKDLVKREYLGKKDVPVTHVVYLKPPPAASREAELAECWVDKYGRIVEESTRDGVRRILVKEESDAVGNDTRIRQGARRDPFRKDLAFVTGKGPRGDEKAAAEPPPKDFPGALKKAQVMLEELRKAKEENREAEGQKLYERLLDYYLALKRDVQQNEQPGQLAQVEEIRRQAEQIWGGLDRLMKKLRGVYVKVLQHFDKDECEEMQKGIEELKKAQGSKELVERPEQTEVSKWIGELEPLVTKCRTRQELAKKRILLSGTLIHDNYQYVNVDGRVIAFGHSIGSLHPIRFMKPDRLAIINEKMYRVGDSVEVEGVRVEKIWAHGVQVSLRDETRDIPIRQK